MISKPSKPLTKLQSDVFDYMIEFFKANDQLPPVRSIAFLFDKYDNQIHEMQIAFAKRGLIERNAVGKWRFTRVKV